MDNLKAKEITVPSQKEAFEAQVLVITQPHKEIVYPIGIVMSTHYPLEATMRVLDSKRYHVELVASSVVNGRPTLIIHEDEKKDD